MAPGRSSRDRSPDGAGTTTTATSLVHFSSASGYTQRFVEKLGLESTRIPLYASEPELVATGPYVLLLPTYGGEEGRHSIPPQVLRFLNNAGNRDLLRGVIGAGNTNFGTSYCLAARKIAAKCDVPLLYRFELMGTPEDVDLVRQGLEQFWTQQSQSRP